MIPHRKHIVSIILGALVFMAAGLLKTNSVFLELMLYLVLFLLAGGSVLLKAIKRVFHGQIFDENILISIAAIGVFSIGKYSEGTAVMLLYQFGQCVQGYAAEKFRIPMAGYMGMSMKSNTEIFINRFVRYYTQSMVVMAVVLALVPPLLLEGALFNDWIYRALTFLVIACPYSLAVSVPLGFCGGIGTALKKGVLVKSGNALENLRQTEVIVFGKTGTLTKGTFRVKEIVAFKKTEGELLEMAAYAESFSKHPIAFSLVQKYGMNIDRGRISDVEEIAGCGVIAKIDGCRVAVGNHMLISKLGFRAIETGARIETVVHVIIEQRYCGYIVVEDELRKDSESVIRELKRIKIRQTVMLTGDSGNAGNEVAVRLGIDKVYTELLPGEKLEKLEVLLDQKMERGKLVFMGDSVEDTSLLARADLGVAMRGFASEKAMEAAEIVIMTDEPVKIVATMKISCNTIGIVHQNIAFALGVKILLIGMGAFGMTSMWGAVFADVGVLMITILNTARLLKGGQYK